jgi:uncharacterized protein (TIGR02757 family)
MKSVNYELKDFLDEKVDQFNQPQFIENDPVLVPHQFEEKEDIEIAGFLTASIAWGQRKTIIKNAVLLMKLMDNDPYRFIMSANKKDISVFHRFVHRTFNGEDCMFFIRSLINIYRNKGGIHNIFHEAIQNGGNIKDGLIAFRKTFFEIDHPKRTRKHISDIQKKSAAKRLNMYLRWMIRNDGKVDFGIWKDIAPSKLYIPLDVHTGNISRKLGLLDRNINDWQSVEELTEKLKQICPEDPIKYDYALFGLGAIEKF